MWYSTANLPDPVRITYQLRTMLTYIKPKMATLITITRSHWKMSLLLPSPLYLWHSRSYTLYTIAFKKINWYTHRYFSLHKLVVLFFHYYFATYPAITVFVTMLLKSTCKFFIKVLHINVSWPLSAAREMKLLKKKPKNKKTTLCCLFSPCTL